MSGSGLSVFETPGDVVVRATLVSPDVEIDPWDRDVTEVELVVLRPGGGTDEALAAVEVEHRALADGRHRVTIEQKRRKGLGIFARDPALVVRVRCPRRAAVEVHATSSDVRCSGAVAAAAIRSTSGDIRLATVDGPATVETASGDVQIGACGDLEARLVSGTLEAGDVEGSASITTVSGDVRVRAFGGEAARVQSVSGDVVLEVAPGRRLWLDVSSVSGTTTSELDEADAPAGGGASVVELRVRTVSGNVHLGRAALEPGLRQPR